MADCSGIFLSRNSILKLSLPLLLLSFSGAMYSHAQDNLSEGFELVRKDEGVELYERWITFPGKEPPVKSREVKAEFFINTTVYELLWILKDESQVRNWQRQVSKFKVFQQADSSCWLEYTYHDIPWPVSDQDHLLEYRLRRENQGEKVFVSFRSRIDPKLAPEQEGVTRMELSGSWSIEQIAPQQVKVTYRILSMPIGIPRIFTDPVIRNNMINNIKALTALVEK